jgi:hypothetical protein
MRELLGVVDAGVAYRTKRSREAKREKRQDVIASRSRSIGEGGGGRRRMEWALWMSLRVSLV